MPTIAHISDLHLQSGVPARQAQVEPILQKINVMKPDLVVISGDVTDGGWDSLEELKWAKGWLDVKITPKWIAVPGNHDVGNFATQPQGAIDEDRVNQWGKVFDTGEIIEIGCWQLLCTNSMMFGMGGPIADEHLCEISYEINESPYVGKWIALLMHSPLFSKTIAEKDPAIDYWVGPKKWRQSLWESINNNLEFVKLIGSGHVHQTRLTEVDGVKIAWAPPASGTWVHAPGLPNPPMPQQTGFFLHTLHDDGRVETELVECAPMLKLYEHNPWP
ncbi:MAG: metallophosphoesterase [Phycisphaeraceae bacterium]|nr:metallophosphoesterase [Phycisphaeraceae bacterium]